MNIRVWFLRPQFKTITQPVPVGGYTRRHCAGWRNTYRWAFWLAFAVACGFAWLAAREHNKVRVLCDAIEDYDLVTPHTSTAAKRIIKWIGDEEHPR